VTHNVAGIVICAAFMHAAWNALLRKPSDRLQFAVTMSIVAGVAAVPLAVVEPLPLYPSWIFLFCSELLQAVYAVLLVFAYKQADLGQVYPIARGTIPMFATLGAALFVHEIPGFLSAGAIVLISLGAMTLAGSGARIRFPTLCLAIGTGVVVACFSVLDGIGARLSGNAIAYAMWGFIVGGIFMASISFIVGRSEWFSGNSRSGRFWSTAAGLAQFLSYGLVVWAYSRAPVGSVVALRQISIVFAILFAKVFLGEQVTRRRFASVVLIVVGAVALSYR